MDWQLDHFREEDKVAHNVAKNISGVRSNNVVQSSKRERTTLVIEERSLLDHEST
jgi:hypothetical protein